MASSEINDLPQVYRMRRPSSHCEKVYKLLDDIVPLDTLPPVLVQHNPKTKSRPPLLHYGFPATVTIMLAICDMNGYKEGVEHPEWGKFDPELVFSVGILFVSLELDLLLRTELVYGSSTGVIFSFGDSRSPLRGETSKELITKLQAYLTANNLPYEQPRWYLDHDKLYWTSY